MLTSKQEALDLLNLWKTDNTILDSMFSLKDETGAGLVWPEKGAAFVISLTSCKVRDISPDRLILHGINGENKIIVSLASVAFSYRERREELPDNTAAEGKNDRSLTIAISPEAVLFLCER